MTRPTTSCRWVLPAILFVASLPGCRGEGSKPGDGGAVGSRAHASANVKGAAGVALDTAGARGKVSEAAGPGPDNPALSFIDNRVAKAGAGVSEIVSLRVWRCGPSCTCPAPCIQAVAPGAQGRWLDVLNEAGQPALIPEWSSADVTGRFSGRIRAGASAEDGRATTLAELRLIGAPTPVGPPHATAPELSGAQAKVIVEGIAATKSVPKIEDGRPFLVIAGAYPLADARTEEDAGKLYERLVELGIGDAERHDSRAFADLACCFELVVAGRFADAKGAAARQKLLVTKGLKATYVKRGF